MTKTVVCIGGPADGREYTVSDAADTLTVNYIDPEYTPAVSIDENRNLLHDMIGLDIYRHIKGAKYEVSGNEAVYVEKEESG
jgi:hypothetical protein